MKPSPTRQQKRRRGVIAVLAAVFFIVMLAMVAFAVDVGYVAMARTQLQAAADASALAAAGSSNLSRTAMTQIAQAFAQYHLVGGRHVVLNSSDVQFGLWDVSSRTFTPVSAGDLGTAVRVTVRADTSSGGEVPVFFGRVLGGSSKADQASAVAMVNPRDICFVVDLSSSMRNDAKPGSGNTALIQAVYTDLFGVNATTGNPNVKYSDPTAPDTGYSVSSNDTTAMQTVLNHKGFMIPPPIIGSGDAADASKAYWGAYFTYLRDNGSSISYKSYVNFLTENGRDVPIVSGTASQYSIWSTRNPAYKAHSELTDGGTFDTFPTPEMPTHAVRRAIIAALQIIKERNADINDASQRDRVSLVAFDRKNHDDDNSHVMVIKELTDDYTDVMRACTTLQACGGSGSCTDSDGGLICARNHIKPVSQGGLGRENSNKVVVFLTDGSPNLYESSDSDIAAAKVQHPSGWGSSAAENGTLLQAYNMQGENWSLYAVGVGEDGSQTVMNRLAKMAGTAITNSSGQKVAYSIAKNASTYEATLRGIFQKIVTNPRLRLVQ